tara:strand:- start:6556 stop:7662 length:1107 start_codon:yes stop_codon:yes gene_type:complete
MKILVVGVGAMGEPVAWALKKLGIEVFVADLDKDREFKVQQKLDCKLSKSIVGEFDFVLGEEVDAVVSCISYSATGMVAKECAAHNVRYCDLGGNPDVSHNIHALFKGTKSVCFTDLGLAPGLANIIAEHAYREVRTAQIVQLMCGGLPAHPSGTLKYNLLFHPRGLWNELTGDCDVLQSGQHKIIQALEEVNSLNEYLEVAHTRGGLASTLGLMKARGVQFCSYQTIRIKGHFDYMKFLLLDCGLRHDYEAFEKLISYACPPTTLDKVLLRVRVDDWVNETIIEADNDWTAMQKGTAFPTAAIAAIMAEGKMDQQVKLSMPHNSTLNYSNVPIQDFRDKLKLIGGLPEMFISKPEKQFSCFTDCLCF